MAVARAGSFRQGSTQAATARPRLPVRRAAPVLRQAARVAAPVAAPGPSPSPSARTEKQQATIPAPTLPALKSPGEPQKPETRLQRLARQRGVQMALLVSKPGDAREQEADEAARRVVSIGPFRAGTMPAVAAPAVITRTLRGGLYRKAGATPRARAATLPAAGGGRPLPSGVRGYMEPRFGADFSGVRIHTDSRAAAMNEQVGARAFTIGGDIFFGRGQYSPGTPAGRGLLAHELAHTIQQGAATQTLHRSAASAPVIAERSPVGAQALGISDALDYFADKAYNIPGYRMFTIILGVNPINMQSVDRSAANILRAMIEFIPGGNLITRALDSYGIIEKVANWVQEQIATLGMTGSLIKDAISRFLDSLSWRDIFDLGGVWERAKRIFTEPIDKIITFAANLVTGILGFIKDALLIPLAKLAEGTAGYDLLKAVLGQDPITGDKVPRTADTLIGGFMKLIGQQEIWENIKKANAIARAWAWFQTALEGLVGLVSSIPGRFMELLQSLTLEDVMLLVGAFKKVGAAFASFLGDFISWAGGTVLSLLQIIFEVVAPAAVPYIAKAKGAFKTIIQNPIGFVGNLVKAGIMGFKQFMGNFLTHLKTALVNWLTGTLAGSNVYIPQSFSLIEILKFVLSVLGLTWQNIRQKLVKAIGETAVKVLETGFDLVVTLVREGPAAAWQKIVEGIGNLKQMAIDAIMDFVKEKIVTAAITKLLSMLNPAGAFIQAIIAIYNTIMFFVERLKTIMQVVMSFIDSIAAIAAGTLSAAANRVEKTMAGLLVLVISFLARIAGLGKVSDAVKKLIDKVRLPIDKALDRVITWLVDQAKKLGKLAAQAGVPQDPATRLRLGVDAAVAAVDAIKDSVVPKAVIQPLMTAIKVRYGLKSIGPVEQNGEWWIEALINPPAKKKTRKRATSPQGRAAAATIVGQNIDTIYTTLPTEYRSFMHEGLREVQRSGKGYAAPEVYTLPTGVIQQGRGLFRYDHTLIADYKAEINQIITDLANPVNGPRKLEGNPMSLETDLRQRVNAGQQSFAHGIRAQMRRIRDFLRGPDRLQFAGVEVPLGKKKSVDYTLQVTDATGTKKIAVEVKNWTSVTDAKDLVKKSDRLDSQLSAYVRLAGTPGNNYSEIRLEWVGWAKLAGTQAEKEFKRIIASYKGQATRKGITLVHVPL